MNTRSYKVGMRTIKTGLAVALGMFVADKMGLYSPLFVGLGVINTMQSSVSESFQSGKNRMLSTVTGALVALIMNYLFPVNYFLMGIGIIVLIHILNLLNWKKAISLAAMVFIAVYMNTDDEMIVYAFNRVLDTSVGILVGVLVNYLISAPHSDYQFDSLFKSMKNDIKSIVYDIITERKEIDLAKFKSDLDKLESIYELSIDETRYKISDKAKIDDNLNKLKKMQIIFTDLSSIKALNSKSCINEKNKSTLEEMLKMTLFVKCDNETSNEDIIYNYHLSSLLKNLASLN
ncbi:MAG: aromatic acid exporter family protein [Tissierellales bacterium]|nr:aromatic acid exporter family protein [Tissierellales bacterium]